VHYFLALVRFDVLGSTLRASVVAAATPNVCPFFTVFRAAIIIDVFLLRHLFLHRGIV
jgi:hypothetical protein